MEDARPLIEEYGMTREEIGDVILHVHPRTYATVAHKATGHVGSSTVYPPYTMENVLECIKEAFEDLRTRVLKDRY